MSLTRLADELILHLMDYVHPMDIDNFVLLNRRLYDISYSSRWIQKRRAEKRGARVMVARFGLPKPESTCLGNAYVRFALPGQAPKEAVSKLDCLDLRDDLRWLQQTSDTFAHSVSGLNQPEEDDRIQALIQNAERLGLTLPNSFILMMRSPKLRHCMARKRNRTLELRQLYRYPSLNRQYLVRFASDWGQRYYWALYLDDAGHHCVLRTEHDILADGENPDATQQHPEEEVPMMSWDLRSPENDDLTLVSVDFESYVARVLLDRWVRSNEFEWGLIEPYQQAYIDYISSVCADVWPSVRRRNLFQRGREAFVARQLPTITRRKASITSRLDTDTDTAMF